MEIALYEALGYKIVCEQKQLHNLFQKIFSINKDNLLIRLYKKYVKREDVDKTIKLLENIKDSDNNFNRAEKKLLDTLINVFQKATYSSEYSFQHEDDHTYIPVRIIIFDEPFCTLSTRVIPLEDYENNEGEPFWMRPDYIIEHYSQTYRKS